MFDTCLFCGTNLGANEVLEAVPVGRWIAFDPAKGRLWVVCPRCGRWNLSPLESRWEGVEACERAFRGTPTRYSTDNIGLARVPGGVDLVRVGAPERPEFAAWRYGDLLLRRRRKHRVRLAASGAVLGVTNSLMAGLPAIAYAGLGLATGVAVIGCEMVAARYRLVAPIGITTASGGTLVVQRMFAGSCRIQRTPGGDSWVLHVPAGRGPAGLRYEELSGEAAVRALALLLPHTNPAGAKARHVQEAVSELQRVGSPGAYFAAAEVAARARGWRYGVLQQWPSTLRLAMEMAAHEEVERERIASELAHLERAWREAELIAAAADRLALPAPPESGGAGQLRRANTPAR
jgi:hypothetical protein